VVYLSWVLFLFNQAALRLGESPSLSANRVQSNTFLMLPPHVTLMAGWYASISHTYITLFL
jgi:hypothetical protein